MLREFQPTAERSGSSSELPAELVEHLYDQLREIAARQLQRERPDHTLQPTALVHEAFLRISRGKPMQWGGRAHFLAIASRVMRQILVNHAKRRQADKRGGAAKRIPLQIVDPEMPEQEFDLQTLDEALTRLAQRSQRQSRIVEMRFFGAMTVNEIAATLHVSTTTVENDWYGARAWLSRELRS